MPSLGEVILYMRGDDSQLENSLDGAKSKAGSFASTATNLIGGAVAGAAVAAGAAILAIGKGALDVSTDTATAAADMAASLGLPIEEAEKFAEVAKRVYGNNFADSVGDAATAVEALAKQLGFTADDPALQTMTENAFRLRDVFDVDVSESIDAVKTLMDNFGISGQEAFDLIAAGEQRGLNRSGDLLDTIGEYSTQFNNAGFDANEFFGILEAGSQGGMLGTDKIADAVKEMGIILNEGSDDAAAAFEAIGLSFEDVSASVAAGDETWADYFPNIIAGLQSIEDPLERSKLQVALFGTAGEDLGVNFTDAFTTTKNELELFGRTITTVSLDASTSFEGIEGSVDSLDAKYATFGSAVEGIWRRLTVSISPYTDKLLEMVNDAMPKVMAAFDTFDQNVGPIMDGVGATINTVVEFVKGAFNGLRTSVDDNATGPLAYWKTWVDTNLPLVQTLIQNILSAIQTAWQIFGPAIELIASTAFNNIWLLIDTIMRTIGDLITLALQILTGDWEGAWSTMEGIVTRIWDTIRTVVGNQLTLLKDLFSQIDWNAVGAAIIEGVKDGIRGAWDGLKSWFAGKLAELRNMLPFSEPKDSSSPLHGLPKAGKSIIGNVRDGMEAEISRLKSSFGDGLGAFASGVTNQPAMAASGGMNITVNVSGEHATHETGRKVGRGILDELRKRGG